MMSIRGWIKGVDFPVLPYRQVFTNKDGSLNTYQFELTYAHQENE